MSEYIIDYESVPLKWRDGYGLSDIDLTEEIVRCRDCVYFAADRVGELCGLFDFEMIKGNMADGYCAWGKRRDE